jgi:hypothetical protein
MGKTSALIGAAERLFRETPDARLLVLVPLQVLVDQFRERLSASGVPAIKVDRYGFRELRNALMHLGTPWPQGAATVMSTDLAQEADVIDVLRMVGWDLAIVDEATSIDTKRSDLLRSLKAASKRLVVAGRRPEALDSDFGGAEVTSIVWEASHLFGQGGELLFQPTPSLVEHPFTISSAEIGLLSRVEQLCSLIDWVPRPPDDPIVGLLDTKTFLSSPAALDRVLTRLLILMEPSGSESDREIIEIFMPQRREVVTRGKLETAVRAKLHEALEVLGNLQEDSKLKAFLGLIRDLRERSQRICVITFKSETLFYLAEALDEERVGPLLLHDRMSPVERQQSERNFAENGGVLLSTVGILQGVELPDTQDVVLCELPSPMEAALCDIYTRRFGTKTSIRFHVLVPTNWTNVEISNGLRAMRETVAQERQR